MANSSENMEKLLKWGIANSDPDRLRAETEQLAAPSNAEAAKEKLAWLDAMHAADREWEDALLAVQNHSELEKDTVLGALRAVRFFVEQIDMASNLAKRGAVKQVLELVQHSEEEIRMEAAFVLGTALAHNELVQKKCMEEKAIEILVAQSSSEKSPQVRKKLLLALSALLRHNRVGQYVFLRKHNGASVLGDFLRDPATSVRRKAAHTTLHLLRDGSDDEQREFAPDVVQPMMGTLARDLDEDTAEAVLQFLSTIINISGFKDLIRQNGGEEALERVVACDDFGEDLLAQARDVQRALRA